MRDRKVCVNSVLWTNFFTIDYQQDVIMYHMRTEVSLAI